MKGPIIPKGHETLSKGTGMSFWRKTGLVATLFLVLGGASGASAQTKLNQTKEIVTETQKPRDLRSEVDTAKYDFRNIWETIKSNEGFNEIETEVDSIIKESKNFEDWNSLSNQEKKDSIWNILVNSDKIKGIISDMAKNPDVITAIEQFKIKTIENKFIKETNHEERYGYYGFAIGGIIGSFLVGFFMSQGKKEE